MTLKRPRSRSHEFCIKYLEYGARYDVGHSGGQMMMMMMMMMTVMMIRTFSWLWVSLRDLRLFCVIRQQHFCDWCKGGTFSGGTLNKRNNQRLSSTGRKLYGSRCKKRYVHLAARKQQPCYRRRYRFGTCTKTIRIACRTGKAKAKAPVFLLPMCIWALLMLCAGIIKLCCIAKFTSMNGKIWAELMFGVRKWGVRRDWTEILSRVGGFKSADAYFGRLLCVYNENIFIFRRAESIVTAKCRSQLTEFSPGQNICYMAWLSGSLSVQKQSSRKSSVVERSDVH